ncbi:MAG: DUF167 domain-containing protein [Opitutaceae bacterium]
MRVGGHQGSDSVSVSHPPHKPLPDPIPLKIQSPISHAPPVEGRANEALCEFLADRLDLPRRAITVLRGDTSRQKVLRISGLTLDAVKAALSS